MTVAVHPRIKNFQYQIREFTDWIACRNASCEAMDQGFFRQGVKCGFVMINRIGATLFYVKGVATQADLDFWTKGTPYPKTPTNECKTR